MYSKVIHYRYLLLFKIFKNAVVFSSNTFMLFFYIKIFVPCVIYFGVDRKVIMQLYVFPNSELNNIFPTDF